MASSFKIKLKLPPNPNQAGIASGSSGSPQRSSVPVEGGSSIADGSSVAEMSDEGGDDGEEMDELEDSPPPASVSRASGDRSVSATGSPSSKQKSQGTSGNANAATSGSSKNGTSSATSAATAAAALKAKTAGRAYTPQGLPKPVDMMTIEEIEALPAAKRRKSLKARGAAGPGRGWRKGLKMDQKPVYVQPGESPPVKVAPSTPTSFSKAASGSRAAPRSSLARSALSKTSTPMRSSSPDSRDSPMALDDLLLETAEPSNRPRKSDMLDDRKAIGNGSTTQAGATSSSGQNNATAAIGNVLAPAPTNAARQYTRSIQPVLPLAKIPTGFMTVTPLDRSISRKAVRPWKRQTREIVSITGKAWTPLTWIANQQSLAAVEKEALATIRLNENLLMTEDTAATSSPIAEMTAPSVLAEKRPLSPPKASSPLQHTPRTSQSPVAEIKPSFNPTSQQPPIAVDWRGNSAAFSAAQKHRPVKG